MGDDKILFQVTLRKIDKPPFVEGDITVSPTNPVEYLAYANLVMLNLKVVLDEFSSKYGFAPAGKDMR